MHCAGAGSKDHSAGGSDNGGPDGGTLGLLPPQLIVRNTFLDIDDEQFAPPFRRQASAPGRLGEITRFPDRDEEVAFFSEGGWGGGFFAATSGASEEAPTAGPQERPPEGAEGAGTGGGGPEPEHVEEAEAPAAAGAAGPEPEGAGVAGAQAADGDAPEPAAAEAEAARARVRRDDHRPCKSKRQRVDAFLRYVTREVARDPAFEVDQVPLPRWAGEDEPWLRNRAQRVLQEIQEGNFPAGARAAAAPAEEAEALPAPRVQRGIRGRVEPVVMVIRPGAGVDEPPQPADNARQMRRPARPGLQPPGGPAPGGPAGAGAAAAPAAGAPVPRVPRDNRRPCKSKRDRVRGFLNYVTRTAAANPNFRVEHVVLPRWARHTERWMRRRVIEGLMRVRQRNAQAGGPVPVWLP